MAITACKVFEFNYFEKLDQVKLKKITVNEENKFIEGLEVGEPTPIRRLSDHVSILCI